MYAYIGAWTTKAREGAGKGITVCRLTSDSCEWEVVQTAATLDNPSYLCVSKERHTLYVAHGDGDQISCYSIDATSGTLQPLNSQQIVGFNPVHLELDPTERFLLVADYGGGSIQLFPLNNDGSLLPMAARTELRMVSDCLDGQSRQSHPHQIAFDPQGDYFLVPDKGLDRVSTYRIVNEPLALKVVRQFHGSPNSGPRHITFDRTGAHVYLVNELDSTVSFCRYHRAGGALHEIQKLSTVPKGIKPQNLAAAILLDSDQRYLLVTNRGHNSIVIYARNQTTGELESASWQSTMGRGPRFAAHVADYRICVANALTNTIETFVSSRDGIAHDRRAINTASPVCVAFF